MRKFSFSTILRFALLLVFCVALCSVADAKPRRRARVPKDKPIITPPTLVERVQNVRSALLNFKTDSRELRMETLLRIGLLNEADTNWAGMEKENPVWAAQLRAQLFLQRYQFAEARTAIAQLNRKNSDPASRYLQFQWLFLAEDLSRVDSLTRAAFRKGDSSDVVLLARGELAFRQMNYDEAWRDFSRVSVISSNSKQAERAQLGMARVLHKQDRYQEAFDRLERMLDTVALHDEVLTQMGITLIALSRVGEAIEILEEATRWNPWNETAQYYLGNGYARLNYSQLLKQHKDFFLEGAAAVRLTNAATAFSHGKADSAKTEARALIAEHAKAVEPLVLASSIEWNQGLYDSAATDARAALELLPGYGRARNAFAKALEALRMKQNVHRAADSAAFAAKEMPVIPRIAEFVINWKNLSPRHQKQIALSVLPWKGYLPVLVDCGSRFYIKPLHEKLSECPEMETMRDTRIDYDSRLWDDVRGCGGFITVTGIEDVERSIFYNYNTVLHELTHQVHGILPPEDASVIRDTYHAARLRENRGTKTFFSRYQQASVWEYFAEGANAYFSPRRDPYDTREIVRERLVERDTTLVRLVERFLPATNLEACYPVGLINAAEQAVEKQKIDDALSFAQRAQKRAPHSVTVLAELSHLYSLRDQDTLALVYADTLLSLFPSKATSYVQKTDARFFTDGDSEFAVKTLSDAIPKVDSTEQQALRQALGMSLWYLGRYAESAAQFREILKQAHNDPNALWGLGLALGDAGLTAASDSAFREALLQRNGIVELRIDYARMLLTSGKLEEALKQLEEAQLLERGDPMLLTMKGWLNAEWGVWKEAMRLLDRALELAPNQRLASVLRLNVMKHYQPPRRRDAKKRLPLKKEAEMLRAMEQTDIPQWEFLARKSAYIPARTWPQYQRELLKRFSEDL